jgi:hypothetical protein
MVCVGGGGSLRGFLGSKLLNIKYFLVFFYNKSYFHFLNVNGIEVTVGTAITFCFKYVLQPSEIYLIYFCINITFALRNCTSVYFSFLRGEDPSCPYSLNIPVCYTRRSTVR